MEFNDAMMLIIDELERAGKISGVVGFLRGMGIGIAQKRFTPVIVGIFMASFCAYVPDVMKAVVGIEEPSEQVKVLDDGSALDIGDDEGAKSDHFLLLAPLLVIVFIVVRTLDNESSVQDEDDALVVRNQNQSPSPPEEIVLPDTQPDPELQNFSSSVGSLKSTRKIQLD